MGSRGKPDFGSLNDARNNPWLFLAFTFAVAITGGAIGDGLQVWPGRAWTIAIGSILVLGLGYFLRVVPRLGRLLRRGGNQTVASDVPTPDEQIHQCRGLITMVSSGTGTSHRDAANHHLGIYPAGDDRLQYAWLFHTDDSTDRANEELKRLEQRGVQTQLIRVDPAFDAQDFFLEVKGLIQKARDEKRLRADDIAVDITAGLRNLAVEAVIACIGGEAQLEYMKGTYIDGKLDRNTPSVAVKIAIDTQITEFEGNAEDEAA